MKMNLKLEKKLKLKLKLNEIKMNLKKKDGEKKLKTKLNPENEDEENEEDEIEKSTMKTNKKKNLLLSNVEKYLAMFGNFTLEITLDFTKHRKLCINNIQN